MVSWTMTAFVALSWTGVASASFYSITGVHDGVGSDGSRPARLNINSLQNDQYAWPVYIQALAAMQSTSQTDITSYFQIAGIHGRPYTAWDNVNGPYSYTGYCTHDSILFPSWHRPYLALFEVINNTQQQLNSKAQLISAQYTGADKAKYQAAAKTLRMPYWDWAASAGIPDILNTPRVSIMTPGGFKQINNPLYSYTFPALNQEYFPRTGASDSYLAGDAATVRDPNASSNLERAGLTAITYNLFSRISDYSTFATQAVSGSSLEAVHGTVHVYVGGDNGQMTQLSYAAFDPIFWLHHANVDRIFALWQATHPNTYVPSQGLVDGYGTYTIGPNTKEFSTTGLTPFTSNTGGSMYTSDSARSMSTFGYTYPEISDWNQNSAQLASAVTAQVNALYAPPATQHKREHARDLASSVTKEWFCLISVDKFDLDSSFIVLVFLGAPPADPSAYKGASNLAGSLYVASPPANRISKGQMTTHAEVPLKAALEAAALSDYSPDAVAAYLTANLQWRVQKTDGTVVDVAELETLKISVQSEDVTPPKNDYEFPTYDNPTAHPGITDGKAGGA